MKARTHLVVLKQKVTIFCLRIKPGLSLTFTILMFLPFEVDEQTV